jgi:Lon protease-like protein
MANANNTPKSLPEVLPVFPLTGAVLFPGMILPLHVFEPRYRTMVEDALGTDAVLGMIQPVVPRQDNRPLPGTEKENPELYDLGCAGYIERWQKLADGRYVLELRGVSRFRWQTELPLNRGYRRVKASYSGFADSPIDRNWRCNRADLLKALEEYCSAHNLGLQLGRVEELSDVELVNMLGMSLPFHPTEKQAMLVAPSLQDREAVLLNLLSFGSGTLDPEQAAPPRTVH